MLLGGKAFVGFFICEGRSFMNGVSALIQKAAERCRAPSAMRGHSEKAQAVNQEAGLHQHPTMPAPWSWTSSLQN